MLKNKGTTGLYLLLIVVATISMVYYTAGALALRQEVFYASRYADVHIDYKNDGQTVTAVAKEAKAAGLSDGDFLLAVDGVPYWGEMQVHEVLQRSKPGDLLTLTARSPSGNVRDVAIRLPARKRLDSARRGYMAILAQSLGVPLLGLLIAYWVLAARPHDLNAWLVFLLLAFPETVFSTLDISLWPNPWYTVFGMWIVIVQAFVFSALLWFGFLFPERWRGDRRFPWFKYVILAASVVAYVIELWFGLAQRYSVQTIAKLGALYVWNDHLESWLQVICIVFFLTALFDKLRSASTADARRRLRVLAIGSALSLGSLMIIFTVGPLFGMDPQHGSWDYAVGPLFSLFPLTLAYVLTVQRAMDIRILLRMGTKYLLARATVLTVEIVFVTVLILRFIIPMVQRKEHPLLNFLLLAVCLGVLFQVFVSQNSLTQRFQRWLDRSFFREAYNSEVLLSELSEQVRQLTDKNELFEIILGRISQVLHVPQISILLRGSEVFHLEHALGVEFGGPVVLPENSATIQNLLRTNRPATLYRDRPEEWFIDASSEEKALLRGINAELLLPMSGRAQLLGLIALGPKKSEESYTPTDLRTLQSVSAQTGLTLEVVELVRTLAEQAASRERINREIEIAREVQQRLFPQSFPLIPGIRLAGMCRPQSQVGGDYYDFIEMDDGHLGLAIGDVSGKGISAALIMASLRASLRGLIWQDAGDLGRMMQTVNRLMYEASSSSRYATFFFATFHPQTREFCYVNAGHNPPVLLTSSGTLHRLEACGPVVGLLPFASYEAKSLIFAPGDLLIGYTDGISEAMTADGEEWGETRMLDAVPRRPVPTAQEVLDRLFSAADEFTAGAEQHDDMTLVIMKVAEAGA